MNQNNKHINIKYLGIVIALYSFIIAISVNTGLYELAFAFLLLIILFMLAFLDDIKEEIKELKTKIDSTKDI